MTVIVYSENSVHYVPPYGSSDIQIVQNSISVTGSVPNPAGGGSNAQSLPSIGWDVGYPLPIPHNLTLEVSDYGIEVGPHPNFSTVVARLPLDTTIVVKVSACIFVYRRPKTAKMLSISAKQFANGTIMLATMLLTSLAVPTHDDDQSATEKSNDVDHVTQQQANVSVQLAGLRCDVIATHCKAPDVSVSNGEYNGANLTLSNADLSAVRHAVESMSRPCPAPTNHSSHGKFQHRYFI